MPDLPSSPAPDLPASPARDLPTSPAEELVAEQYRTGAPLGPIVGTAAVEAGTEGFAAKQRLGIGAWLAIAWMVLLVLAALLAPFLPIPIPGKDAVPGLARHGPATSGHVLGLDSRGQDMFGLLAYGARTSLEIAIGAIGLGFLFGGFLGLIAGYIKGWIGNLIGGLLDVMLAVPPLILALALVAFLGQKTINIIVGLAIVATPIVARIARASALSWSEREFVLAARAQGARHRRVMLREVLPNTLPAMFSIALLGIAIVIVAEGGLALLGVSVKSTTPSWGNIIAANRNDIRQSPYMLLEPSIAIFLTVLALNYLGDVVRVRFDVRESAL